MSHMYAADAARARHRQGKLGCAAGARGDAGKGAGAFAGGVGSALSSCHTEVNGPKPVVLAIRRVDRKRPFEWPAAAGGGKQKFAEHKVNGRLSPLSFVAAERENQILGQTNSRR